MKDLDSPLTSVDRLWIGSLNPDKKINIGKLPTSKTSLILRLSDLEFQCWWKIQNKATIFFNGASKGNHRAAGASGVIFPSKELYLLTFVGD